MLKLKLEDKDKMLRYISSNFTKRFISGQSDEVHLQLVWTLQKQPLVKLGTLGNRQFKHQT